MDRTRAPRVGGRQERETSRKPGEWGSAPRLWTEGGEEAGRGRVTFPVIPPSLPPKSTFHPVAAGKIQKNSVEASLPHVYSINPKAGRDPQWSVGPGGAAPQVRGVLTCRSFLAFRAAAGLYVASAEMSEMTLNQDVISDRSELFASFRKQSGACRRGRSES